MKIVDLSRVIKDGMQVFPGDAPPVIKRLAGGGFRTSEIFVNSHAGTHMDAPAHLAEGTVTLDMLPPERFFGPAILADVSAARGKIEISDLAPHRRGLGAADCLILRTGWEDKFGGAEYLTGYPVLTPGAARYVLERGIGCVGTDTISADPAESADCSVHRILLGSGALIIENLRGLKALPEGKIFRLAALPVPIFAADGAPARVMAILED